MKPTPLSPLVAVKDVCCNVSYKLGWLLTTTYPLFLLILYLLFSQPSIGTHQCELPKQQSFHIKRKVNCTDDLSLWRSNKNAPLEASLDCWRNFIRFTAVKLESKQWLYFYSEKQNSFQFFWRIEMKLVYLITIAIFCLSKLKCFCWFVKQHYFKNMRKKE